MYVVFVCMCMYGQLLVLDIQPCCSCSFIHVELQLCQQNTMLAITDSSTRRKGQWDIKLDI